MTACALKILACEIALVVIRAFIRLAYGLAWCLGCEQDPRVQHAWARFKGRPS
ncbi:MAG: hypothetical protein QF786_00120 [Vicinamibacterales bacterium]|jgi:hypothetical protein|nr:hypothetical protein [Vicinamibacterales bacterium]